MNNNDELHPIRLAIESISNFLKIQPETKVKQLDSNSKPEKLGDPLHVELNKMDGPTGSDSTSPTVSVKVGSIKGGRTPTTGQHKANFQQKTELAENNSLDTENLLRQYVIKTLTEHFDAKLKEDSSIKEAVDELLDEPSSDEENNEKKKSENIESEGMARNLSMGKGKNLKPSNYPENLQHN